MLQISKLNSNQYDLWDAYIDKNKNAHFCQSTSWKKAIESTYGYKSIFLMAKEEEKIKGILPLFYTSNFLQGYQIISVPFSPYGGICADNSLATNLLLNYSLRMLKLKRSRIQKFEFRNIKSILKNRSFQNNEYLTSLLILEPDEEAMFSKFKKNKRKTIKKSEKFNLIYRQEKNADNFYNIYSENMSYLGSPVHSKLFFQNLLEEFKDKSSIHSVFLKGNCVYSSFYIADKNKIVNCWSSTLNRYRKYYPTDFGIWNTIKYAIRNGFEILDFGRSQYASSNLEFKRRWGAKPVQLCYEYISSGSSHFTNSKTNPNRKRFEKIWKIMPLNLSKKLGPLIRSNFP